MKGAAQAAPFYFSRTTIRNSLLDQLLIAADEALRTLSGAASPARPSPARAEPEGGERRISAGLMRVNHSGEICAQALYSAQALFARDPKVRQALKDAAGEERDHLAWCRGRLHELGSRPSILDPLWYAGSFALGMASGVAGDRWSMGFLSETEAQVERHLERHLEKLPRDDYRSRAIVRQMREDEARHGSMGRALGAADLPPPVKAVMGIASKVMTGTAYYV